VGDIVGRAGGGHTPYSIREMYHSPITDLVRPQRGPMKKKKKMKWEFCQTSDDTIFTLAIARAILNEEFICRRNVVCELRAIADPMISNIGLNCLKEADNPDYFHPEGVGPGSAMRVSPIGLIWSPCHLEELVEDVIKTSVITHGDSSAISAACAVAGAITAALESLPPLDIIRISQKAAFLGRKWGKPSTLPDIPELIEQAYESIKHIPTHEYEGLYLALNHSVGIKREACFYCNRNPLFTRS
jgi:ADP-ribosylglycohydrolase